MSKGPPALEVKFWLTPIGYQVDIDIAGEQYGSAYRGFANDYEVDDLLKDLYKYVMNMIEDFRKEH